MVLYTCARPSRAPSRCPTFHLRRCALWCPERECTECCSYEFFGVTRAQASLSYRISQLIYVQAQGHRPFFSLFFRQSSVWVGNTFLFSTIIKKRSGRRAPSWNDLAVVSLNSLRLFFPPSILLFCFFLDRFQQKGAVRRQEEEVQPMCCLYGSWVEEEKR